MKLLTKAIREKLLENGKLTEVAQIKGEDEPDHKPVVKFFNPYGAGTWLITEAERDEETDDLIMFGLCDLGVGFPELGNVSLNELSSLRFRGGLGIERDKYWEGTKPLSLYAEEAMLHGSIRE